MCNPGHDVSAALSRAGSDGLNNRITPQQSLTISAFDRIVATLSAHPIDEGYFWDSVNSLEHYVDHTDSFNRALRAQAFRTFAASHTQDQVNNNIWNAIGRRYANMSQDHRGTLNVFLRDKVRDSLSGQLAWETHSQAVSMMDQAVRSLNALASNDAQLQEWKARLRAMLSSPDQTIQRAGQQVMDGLGIESVVALDSTERMASSIRATSRLITDTLENFRIIAPQNLFKTISQLPGAKESLIRSLGASQSSFIVLCINQAVSRGESQLSTESWVRSISGITAGIAVGIITGGASTPLVLGLLAGAGTSAVMGLPGLLQSIRAVDEARIGEASGIMDDQAIERASSAQNWSTGTYIAGILIPNGAGTYIGNAASSAAGQTAGAGLSTILEIIGALAPSSRESAGFTALWEKLNSMTPEAREEYSTAFDTVMEQKNIPQSARPAVLAAFVENNLASLDKTASKASKDLESYCDQLGRQQ
ncbi:hypothetical protein [Neptuniibacter sp. 2_MG-2023]|uniref:hypothetical protein n=1 Tax=Neptuniibacter sp. 2_MG-2023 TaxID=3062671 RepID=UPI0026E18E2D|nr:hypothetical protein [Neptuniibacter sp. 2_MG-2023]MDO6513800.1 hypothetical protein [Neptuniibacter sp. 2_MG-2023]